MKRVKDPEICDASPKLATHFFLHSKSNYKAKYLPVEHVKFHCLVFS